MIRSLFIYFMKIIGLTGGIGAGKSFISEFLIQHSVSIIDTDVIARQLLEPEQPAWKGVKLQFGDSFFLADGRLDRSRLADFIFKDSISRQKLDVLMHPMIRSYWKSEVSKLKEQNIKLCVVVIPLLFETHAEDQFDTIISMVCSSLTQVKRLEQRGWSLSHIKSRVAAQWPMAMKAKLSQYVIWTECSKESTIAQMRIIFKKIGENI